MKPTAYPKADLQTIERRALLTTLGYTPAALDAYRRDPVVFRRCYLASPEKHPGHLSSALTHPLVVDEAVTDGGSLVRHVINEALAASFQRDAPERTVCAAQDDVTKAWLRACPPGLFGNGQAAPGAWSLAHRCVGDYLAREERDVDVAGTALVAYATIGDGTLVGGRLDRLVRTAAGMAELVIHRFAPPSCSARCFSADVGAQALALAAARGLRAPVESVRVVYPFAAAEQRYHVASEDLDSAAVQLSALIARLRSDPRLLMPDRPPKRSEGQVMCRVA